MVLTVDSIDGTILERRINEISESVGSGAQMIASKGKPSDIYNPEQAYRMNKVLSSYLDFFCYK